MGERSEFFAGDGVGDKSAELPFVQPLTRPEWRGNADDLGQQQTIAITGVVFEVGRSPQGGMAFAQGVFDLVYAAVLGVDPHDKLIERFAGFYPFPGDEYPLVGDLVFLTGANIGYDRSLDNAQREFYEVLISR